MKRKVIGIPGYKAAKEESFGAGINYLDFINHFANPRIILPWEKYVKVDMLLLPGGLDTQPARYGQTPGFRTSNQDVHKEFFMENRLNAYVKRNIPIFGICLGAQMLAVYFGAQLTQDLLFHPQSTERWKTAHNVYSIDEGLTQVGSEHWTSFGVNSHHHQGLTHRGIGTSPIVPLLQAKNEDDPLTEDGYIVEAFAVHNKPIFAVQWHPEELYDAFSITIIRNLLDTI